jgi:actin-related protein 10
MIIPPETNQVDVDPKYLTHTIVEDIKTRFIFVSHMHIPADGSISMAQKTRKKDMKAKYANDSKVEDLFYPIALGSSGGKKLIGTLVVPGWIRGRAAEVLFEGDEDESSVVGCLLESLLKVLKRNILLGRQCRIYLMM